MSILSNMKSDLIKFFLLLLTFSQFSCLFAQDETMRDFELLICDQLKEEFSSEELINCNDLSVQDSDLKIESFVFSAVKGDKITEERVSGNHFNSRIINYINDSKPNTVYIEIIKLSDGSRIPPKKLKLIYN